MVSEAIRADIEALAAALSAGDERGLRSLLSEDYFGHARGADEPSQADRWVELGRDVMLALPDLAITLDEVTDGEDGCVNVVATVAGTHTGELWGAPPARGTHRWSFPLTLRRDAGGWVVNADGPPTVALGALRELGVVPPADQMHLPPRHPIRPPEFLLKLAFTGQAGDKPCAHLAQARVFEPAVHECPQCVATGGFWPALRMCLVCGFVGCCDTSVSKHMRAHYETTGHPIFRSIRLAEGWIWCNEDAAFFERAVLERLAAAARGS